MKAAITVLKEQFMNFYLIKRLSLYEMKSKNRNNYLGMVWEVINPSIQVLIYWFVFGTLRNRAPVEVYPGVEVKFFYWLLAGFILWIFFFKSTIDGSKSIYSRLRLLSKMNFPMSIIPNFVIFSHFYVHLLMLGITIIIFQIAGFFINIYYLQLIYFIFATFSFIFAVTLIISTVSTIIRDVHMFLSSTLRMGLYFSGVLWPLAILDRFPSIITDIMMLNPLYYLIEGYRAALFGTEWYFIVNWEYTLYFWAIVIVFFIFGSILHLKFRRHFIDYL
ncbi:teichoic acid transport system permease protein [Virgibacillus subterraneus]|uniref:Transport permease protein n=1 Tax=Virgibacillus subterraneus TaxID=621109 RepID=A0A1H9AF64_9BACI|nr:ABC transporter permease [Virgibacillus subterraneus]SEP75384.1 teichoic acid transport system permease protein [Virgibacillus subterraneus]